MNLRQRWEREADGVWSKKKSSTDYLGRWMDGWVAECQTRPIAEAHHKTHENDVRSKLREYAGDERRQEGSARLGQLHFNHVPTSCRAGIINNGEISH